MAKRSGTTVTRGQRRFQLFSGGRSDAGGQKMDYYDYNLLAAVILLTCFGLVMLYSVSAYSSYVNFGQNDMYFFERQAGIAFAAFVFLLIVSRLDYHLVTRHAFLIYVIANALLVATRFVGRTINGARRWIYIGPVSFQPAELAKLAVIIFIPTLIVKSGRKFQGFEVPAKISAFGFLTAVLTYRFTENLSTAIIIAGITLALIYIAHPHPEKMLMFGAVILVVGLIFVLILKNRISMDAQSSSFRIQRIITWLNPEETSDEGGYQVMQALYAIGSGGLFGKGLGGTGDRRSNDRTAPVCICSLPPVRDRRERAGPAGLPDYNRHFCPYCDTGYPEYRSRTERYSDDGYYAALCILRGNLHRVPDGRDGAGSFYLRTD